MNSSQPKINIYNRLGVHQDSSGETIHKNFIKLVNSLLLKIKTSNDQTKLLEELRELWVAHDILVDPGCRTDYDLRSLGISTSDNTIIEVDSLTRTVNFGIEQPKETSWRIGELLQAVGTLEQAELEIACDMHRAMPEMQFGRFLVKQSFLTETELQAVLIGQTLLRAGELTLSQLIDVVSKMKKTHQDFKEILLESGYLKNPHLLKLDGTDS